MKHVALLRGINVGGNNLLPMQQLCTLFTASGCANVSSYIQSGNVIFEASAAAATKLVGKVEAAIEKQFGFRPPIQLRSANELADVIAGVPFRDSKMVYVGFLARAPSKDQLATLDPKLGAPDRYLVRGCEIYFDFVGSAARTKLTAGYFDKRLATVITMRNWNTVLKLRELAS
jgi:uncharacterized protein (DUF1697 family)